MGIRGVLKSKLVLIKDMDNSLQKVPISFRYGVTFGRIFSRTLSAKTARFNIKCGVI